MKLAFVSALAGLVFLVIGLVCILVIKKGGEQQIAVVAVEESVQTSETSVETELPVALPTIPSAPSLELEVVEVAKDEAVKKAEAYRYYVPDKLYRFTEEILRETAVIEAVNVDSEKEYEVVFAGFDELMALPEQNSQDKANEIMEEVSTFVGVAQKKTDEVLLPLRERLKVLLGNQYSEYEAWEETRWFGPALEKVGLPPTRGKVVVELLTDMKLRGDRDTRKVLECLKVSGPKAGEEFYSRFKSLMDEALTPTEEKLRIWQARR